MPLPWIKLSTNILKDEKIGYLIHKIGHEVTSVWLGLLTSSDDGIVILEQEILADSFKVTEDKFSEIKAAFIKYGLIEETDEGIKIIISDNQE